MSLLPVLLLLRSLLPLLPPLPQDLLAVAELPHLHRLLQQLRLVPDVLRVQKLFYFLEDLLAKTF
jgi:hypothetical protein